jgi:hypothetical protein
MVKRSLLFCLLLLCMQVAKSQISRGQMMLGGTMAAITGKQTDESGPTSDKTYMELSPQLGFGLSNNWIVGVGGSFISNKSENDSYTTRQKTYLAVLFLRKFHAFSDRFGIFGQLEANGGIMKQSSNLFGTSSEDESTLLSGIVRPGIYFKPGKRFILEGGLGRINYTHKKTDYGNSSQQGTFNTFSVSLFNYVNIGCQFIF